MNLNFSFLCLAVPLHWLFRQNNHQHSERGNIHQLRSVVRRLHTAPISIAKGLVYLLDQSEWPPSFNIQSALLFVTSLSTIYSLVIYINGRWNSFHIFFIRFSSLLRFVSDYLHMYTYVFYVLTIDYIDCRVLPFAMIACFIHITYIRI